MAELDEDDCPVCAQYWRTLVPTLPAPPEDGEAEDPNAWEDVS